MIPNVPFRTSGYQTWPAPIVAGMFHGPIASPFALIMNPDLLSAKDV